jgi:hypothetical protein
LSAHCNPQEHAEGDFKDELLELGKLAMSTVPTDATATSAMWEIACRLGVRVMACDVAMEEAAEAAVEELNADTMDMAAVDPHPWWAALPEDIEATLDRMEALESVLTLPSDGAVVCASRR